MINVGKTVSYCENDRHVSRILGDDGFVVALAGIPSRGGGSGRR